MNVNYHFLFAPRTRLNIFSPLLFKLFKQETDIRQRIFAFSPSSFFNIQRMQFAWKTWSYTAEHPNIQCNIFYYGDDTTLTHTHIHILSRVKIIEILPMLPDGKGKCEVSLFVSEKQICFSFSLRIVIDSFSNDPLPRINFVSWICFSSVIGLSLRCCFILPNYLCLRQRAPIFNW